MRTKLLLFLTSVFLFINTQSMDAQFPSYVKYIKSEPNAVVSMQGTLSGGQFMDDLSWAWNSSVACFPATQKHKFTGKHVLFYTDLPAHSIMHIKLVPKDKSKNMSLYAYSIGQGSSRLVPELSSCISCEVDHKWDYAHQGKTQDHTRTVRLNAINNPYTVVIGVVGAEGLSEGDFDLQVHLETRVEETGEQKPVTMYSAKAEKGKVLAYKGDLAKGTKIYDLSWAWNSAVACFPETQKKKFTGNHILFVTEIPRYSIMDIELIPDDPNANMSLYAYSVGTNSNAYVPNLSSCVSCEADHKWDYKKRGKTQDHRRYVSLNAINNPYKVVIGVTGADGLDKGTFVLKINTKAR